MTYQVLARKWRPQNFTDMVGQSHISSTLCNAINNNRIGHAYLFVGTRGTGKTTTARIFAKAINCLDLQADANPCNKCPVCIEITAGASMDVLEIDGASNNGVDDIRRLRDSVQYTPAQCRFKVYIIDEVHMLSTAAWNALLKTLEEPPAHVKFLFATTEAHKVLPTILSRCQRFDLKRISQGTIARRLHEIAVAENAPFDQAALTVIARAANGGMRDALSIMDQMIAFCSNQQTITEHDVAEVFGLTSSFDLAKIISSMLTDNTKELISEINRIADMGRNLEQLYADLLHFCRNLMICAISGEEAGSILDLDEYDLETARAIVTQSSADTIQKLMDGFLNYDGQLRNTLNKRVFMEMTLVRIMKDAHAVSLNDILARINQLRKTGSLAPLQGSINQPAKVINLPEPQKKDEPTIIGGSPPKAANLVETTEQLVNHPTITPQKSADSPSQEVAQTDVPAKTYPDLKSPDVVPPTISENIKPVSAELPLREKSVQTTNIDHSYELPYSTLLDAAYIDKARWQDPLDLGGQKHQGDFNENDETPGSILGFADNLEPTSPKLSTQNQQKVPECSSPSTGQTKVEANQTEEKEPESTNTDHDSREDYTAEPLTVAKQHPEDAGESSESLANKLWNEMMNNSQSSQFKNTLQSLKPVFCQDNRFYVAYESGQTKLDDQEKHLLESELKKVSKNSLMELVLMGAATSEENDDKPALSSGEEVWERVQHNPFFNHICGEFDGKIIDVRG